MLIHHQSAVISSPSYSVHVPVSPSAVSPWFCFLHSHTQSCKPHADGWQLGQAARKMLILERRQLPEQPRSKTHFILWKRNKRGRSIKGVSSAKVTWRQGERDLTCHKCPMGWRNKRLLAFCRAGDDRAKGSDAPESHRWGSQKTLRPPQLSVPLPKGWDRQTEAAGLGFICSKGSLARPLSFSFVPNPPTLPSGNWKV